MPSREGRRGARSSAGDSQNAIAVDDDDENEAKPRPPPKAREEVARSVAALNKPAAPEPFTLRTRRVMMGKHNFGPAVVAFSADKVEWYPADNYCLPDKTYPLVSVPTNSITAFQVDKQQGGLAIWSMFEPPCSDQLGDKWKPFGDRTEPESSIFIEYDLQPYQASNVAWPSEIVKLSERLKRHAQFVGPGMIMGRLKSSRGAQQVPPNLRKGGGETARPSRGKALQHAASSSQRMGGAPAEQQARGSRSGPAPSAGQQQLQMQLPYAPRPPEARGSSAAGSSSSHSATHGVGGEPTCRRGSRRLAAKRGHSEVVLIYPNHDAKDAVTLTTEEVDRLRQNDFLNDSLVDYELKARALHASPRRQPAAEPAQPAKPTLATSLPCLSCHACVPASVSDISLSCIRPSRALALPPLPFAECPETAGAAESRAQGQVPLLQFLLLQTATQRRGRLATRGPEQPGVLAHSIRRGQAVCGRLLRTPARRASLAFSRCVRLALPRLAPCLTLPLARLSVAFFSRWRASAFGRCPSLPVGVPQVDEEESDLRQGVPLHTHQ